VWGGREGGGGSEGEGVIWIFFWGGWGLEGE
jgi:hypothetical protein